MTVHDLLHVHRLQPSVDPVRPYLYACEPVFVSQRHIDGMAAVVEAVEAVVALPCFQAHVLAQADAGAHFNPGTRGVFFGYDFHLGGRTPQLIEINTNAGGALLNAGRAFRPATPDADQAARGLEQTLVEMFRTEWRLQRGDAPLRTVVIVDTDPPAQFLAPEFQLFQQLFTASGWHTVVADPAELQWHGDRVWCQGRPIDLIYNRLTDFMLTLPAQALLRHAYLAGRVVLTPHPRAHALYADKRILALLCDEPLLRSWGVPADTLRVLREGIPRTVVVAEHNSQALWQARRQLFFKPATGYGSKGAYRGDKLTRRVWQEIRTSPYVAQMFAPPAVQSVCIDGQMVELKVDVRNYVYAGRVQMHVARLFQGQTTNFRTPGGGFAPVYAIDDVPRRAPDPLRWPAVQGWGAGIHQTWWPVTSGASPAHVSASCISKMR